MAGSRLLPLALALALLLLFSGKLAEGNGVAPGDSGTGDQDSDPSLRVLPRHINTLGPPELAQRPVTSLTSGAPSTALSHPESGDDPTPPPGRGKGQGWSHHPGSH
ncbi:hypothetical protein NN561_018929 [Cricetulus griseus]